MTVHRTDPRNAVAHGQPVAASAQPAGMQPAPAPPEPALLRLQRQVGNQQVAALMRHASSEAAPAEGVGPAVEQAIEGARGSGNNLHDGVRRQMESAMGADFSGVRVHADARADTLSRALSARAFATGPDIFFREGEYNPGSSSGRELLAHELAHVVQSGSGVRAKLSVSDPGDDAEREADQVAKAVMQAEQAGPMADAAPPVLARGGAAPGQVHRFWQEAKDWAFGPPTPAPLPKEPFDGDVGKAPAAATIKGGADSYTSLAYDGNDAPLEGDQYWPHSELKKVNGKTFTVERGRSGIVTVHILTWWHTEGAPVYQAGTSDATVSAHFSCDDDGRITIDKEVAMPPSGGGSVVTPFSSGAPRGPNLQLESGVNLTQTTTQTGTNAQDRSSGQSSTGSSETSGGLKAGADGKVASAGAEGGHKTTSAQGTERKSGEQRSSSTSLQLAGTNSLAYQRDVQLVAGPPKRLGGGRIDGFAVDAFQVPSGKINYLGQWWAGLDKDLKNSMRSGSIGVLFTGHADEPGAPGHNQTLGRQRAQAVEKVFKGFAGKDIASRLESAGNADLTIDADALANDGKKPKPRSDPHERRVDFEPKPKSDPHERRVDFELYRIRKS